MIIDHTDGLDMFCDHSCCPFQKVSLSLNHCSYNGYEEKKPLEVIAMAVSSVSFPLPEVLFLKSLWLILLLLVFTATTTIVLLRIQPGEGFRAAYSFSLSMGFWLLTRFILVAAFPASEGYLFPRIDVFWIALAVYQGSLLIPLFKPSRVLLQRLLLLCLGCVPFIALLSRHTLFRLLLMSDPLLVLFTCCFLFFALLILIQTEVYNERTLEQIIQFLPAATLVVDAHGRCVFQNASFHRQFARVNVLPAVSILPITNGFCQEYTVSELDALTGLKARRGDSVYRVYRRPVGTVTVMILEEVTIPYRQVMDLREESHHLGQIQDLLTARLDQSSCLAEKSTHRFLVKELNHLLKDEMDMLRLQLQHSFESVETTDFRNNLLQSHLLSVYHRQLLQFFLWRLQERPITLSDLNLSLLPLANAAALFGFVIRTATPESGSLSLRHADCLYRCVFACLHTLASVSFPALSGGEQVHLFLHLQDTKSDLALTVESSGTPLSLSTASLTLPECFWLMEGTLDQGTQNERLQWVMTVPRKAGVFS